jgi:hypothetical protein
MIGQIRRQHFAVLSTSGRDGAPHSAGVSYGCTEPGDTFVIYIMTRRHLLKARNIESDPRVSLVIPVPRPVLTFLPPATIQLHGQAELLNWDDPIGTAVFEEFWLGRRILSEYREAREGGENRVCFVRIVSDTSVRSYLVGTRLWEMGRKMEAASAKVTLTPGI